MYHGDSGDRRSGVTSLHHGNMRCTWVVSVLLLCFVLQGSSASNELQCVSCLTDSSLLVRYSDLFTDPVRLFALSSSKLNQLCSAFESTLGCIEAVDGCSAVLDKVLQLSNSPAWTQIRGTLTLLCSERGKNAVLDGYACFTSSGFQSTVDACIKWTYDLKPPPPPSAATAADLCPYVAAMFHVRYECLLNATRRCSNESVTFVLSLVDQLLPTISDAVEEMCNVTALSGGAASDELKCMNCLMETSLLQTYSDLLSDPVRLFSLDSSRLDQLCGTLQSVINCTESVAGCSTYLDRFLLLIDTPGWRKLRDAVALLCSEHGKNAVLDNHECFTSSEFLTTVGGCFKQAFDARPSAATDWCPYLKLFTYLRVDCAEKATNDCANNKSTQFVRSMVDELLPDVVAEEEEKCNRLIAESTTTAGESSTAVLLTAPAADLLFLIQLVSMLCGNLLIHV